MYGQVSYDVEVDVSASNAWKLYGALQLAMVMEEGPSPLLEKFELIEGDGGLGTVIKLIFAPGKGPGSGSVTDKFTKCDNEKRIKEVEVIEGGVLDLGFNQYRFCFEIMEKDKNSCIIKSKITYDVNEEAASIASTIPSNQLQAIAEVAVNYLVKMKNQSVD